jgi:hypothetical protein
MLFLPDGFHEKDENEYSSNLYIGVFSDLFQKKLLIRREYRTGLSISGV